MLHLAFATHSEDSDHGGERALLAPFLDRLGVTVHPHSWDDPAVDWASFDGVMVRSTWDYFTKIDAFQDWIRRVDGVTRLANPASVLLWNSDKRYLAVLAGAGVPVIDTVFLAPGLPIELPDWFDQTESGHSPSGPELVVKPTVSGGGRLSGRFAPGEGVDARRLIGSIHAEGKTAMMQPYLAAVDGAGEANVLVFAGEVSHAVTKLGILAAGSEPVADTRLAIEQPITPLPLDAELCAFADEVLDVVAKVVEVNRTDLLHARVDSVIGPDGSRRLMEVELIEPYLYLDYVDPGPARTQAATAYASAIHQWLERGAAGRF